jgi:putative transposase
MKFTFIAKHRGIWPVAWLCEAVGVSRSGFHAWLDRSPSKRARCDEALLPLVRASFVASARTYGARRVWRDVLAQGRASRLPLRSTVTQRYPLTGKLDGFVGNG